MKDYNAIVRRYQETGRTKIVAEEFGLTQNAVRYILKRNGVQIVHPQYLPKPIPICKPEIKEWNINEDLQSLAVCGFAGMCRLFPETLYIVLKRNRCI